jgi:hypothetical protein
LPPGAKLRMGLSAVKIYNAKNCMVHFWNENNFPYFKNSPAYYVHTTLVLYLVVNSTVVELTPGLNYRFGH